MSEPQVILIGGPSGSGKSTLIARLLEIPGTRLAVSATTRPPREGEVDGVAYHFLAPDAFAAKCKGGQLLEWAEVFGNSYGTPRSEIEAHGPGDRLVILDLDVQGLRSLVALGVEHVSVFIAPPSMEVLKERLQARGTESETSLSARLEAAAGDMAASHEYDHLVVNHQVEDSLDELREILGLSEDADVGDRNSTSTSSRP